MVADTVWLPVETQVAPVIEPPPEPAEGAEEEDEEAADELLEEEPALVVLANEHQVEVLEANGLVGKFEALQATPLVCVR